TEEQAVSHLRTLQAAADRERLIRHPSGGQAGRTILTVPHATSNLRRPVPLPAKLDAFTRHPRLRVLQGGPWEGPDMPIPGPHFPPAGWRAPERRAPTRMTPRPMSC